MNLRKRLATPFLIAAVMAVVAPFGSAPAHADSNQQEFEFTRNHECTHEEVIGDLRVKMETSTQDNGDGTTTVTVTQKRHGNQLVGLASGDTYVINEQEEVTETFMISTSLGGTIHTKTVFIHNGENQVTTETPGMDDLHQRLTFVFVNPALPPTMVAGTTECK